MFIPKSQYETGFYSNGELYSVGDSNTTYIGPYWKFKNGQLWSGETPNDSSKKLLPIQSDLINRQESGNELNDQYLYHGIINELTSPLTPDGEDGNVRLLPFPYTPLIKEKDIKSGYINRYFAKHNTLIQYIEINRSTYESFQNTNPNIAWDQYSVITIPWIISGDQYNVLMENKKVVSSVESSIPNEFSPKTPWPQFSQYFKNNYLQFYQGETHTGIVNIDNKRHYPTGEEVSKNLPQAYRLGNKKEVAGQYCQNCSFYNENYCSKWNADVVFNYWCKSYKPQHGKNLKTQQITPTTNYTPTTQPPPPSIGGNFSGGGY
jgi:hypothetical protein